MTPSVGAAGGDLASVAVDAVATVLLVASALFAVEVSGEEEMDEYASGFYPPDYNVDGADEHHVVAYGWKVMAALSLASLLIISTLLAAGLVLASRHHCDPRCSPPCLKTADE